MTKCVNGEFIELTAEEIAELEQMEHELSVPEQTTDERIAELETALEEQIAVNAEQDDMIIELYESMMEG